MMAMGSLGRSGNAALTAALTVHLASCTPAATCPGIDRGYSSDDSVLRSTRSAFGRALAITDDVDGDGIPDALVGDPVARTHGRASNGAVYVLSCRTGSILRRIAPPQALDSVSPTSMLFGTSVSSVPAASSNGPALMVVGAPTFSPPHGPTSAGAVAMLSRDGGDLLWCAEGASNGSRLGTDVMALRDASAVEPFIVASVPFAVETDGMRRSGQLWLLGLRDGSRRVVPPAPGQRFSHLSALASLGDVDGDGAPEIVVGCEAPVPTSGKDLGYAAVVSVESGRVWLRVGAPSASPGFGAAVANVGDWDRDGLDDFAVGSPGAATPRVSSTTPCGVHVFSSATGSVLWSRQGAVPDDGFGASLLGGADLDRDGYPDVVVGSPESGAAGVRRAGAVMALSGRDRGVLWVRHGQREGGVLGYSLTWSSDLDGDGVRDLLAGAPGDVGEAARSCVVALSGMSGSVLWTASPWSEGSR